MGRGRPRYYVVEQIIDSKMGPDGNKLYLIKWQDWSHRSNTWEPLKHLMKVQSMVKKFDNLQRVKNEKQRKRTRHVRRRTEMILKGTRRSKEDLRKIRIRNAKYHRIETKSRLNKSENSCKQEENSHAGQVKRCLLSRDKRLILQSQGSLMSSHYLKKQENQQNNHISDTQQKESYQQPARNLRKRLTIRKSKMTRLTRSRTAIAIKKRLLESKKQMRQSQTSEGYLKKQEQEQENVDIEQVLLNCMNYQNVVVQLKNEELHYRIPYYQNSKTLYFQTTSSEILKVNPDWLTGYFQGFYL